MRVRPQLHQGDIGWLLVAGTVIAIDLAVEDGQTLSEAADRYLEHRPGLTYTVALITVAHILNFLPAAVDPYHRGFLLARRLLGRTTPPQPHPGQY